MSFKGSGPAVSTNMSGTDPRARKREKERERELSLYTYVSSVFHVTVYPYKSHDSTMWLFGDLKKGPIVLLARQPHLKCIFFNTEIENYTNN